MKQAPFLICLGTGPKQEVAGNAKVRPITVTLLRTDRSVKPGSFEIVQENLRRSLPPLHLTLVSIEETIYWAPSMRFLEGQWRIYLVRNGVSKNQTQTLGLDRSSPSRRFGPGPGKKNRREDHGFPFLIVPADEFFRPGGLFLDSGVLGGPQHWCPSRLRRPALSE